MPTDKKVSVVIPTFNRAYCIKGPIESVLKQTHQNLEIFVVDDESSPGFSKSFERYPHESTRMDCSDCRHGWGMRTNDGALDRKSQTQSTTASITRALGLLFSDEAT